MPDFAHLLNMKADDVKEIPVLPMGEYSARVGQYKFDEANVKGEKRPVVNVPIQLTARLSGGDEPLPPKLPELRHTFWLTNNEGMQDEHTLNPIKVFGEACGVPTAGRSIGEILADTGGSAVTVTIGHRPNPRNADRPFAEIKSFGLAS